MDRTQFATLVRDALAHAGNRVYLGKHPLTRMLNADGAALTADTLRDLLLARIEELKPVGGDGTQDADWRRYRHLVLRYAERQSLEQVAYALGVSVRQATRDHHQAVETLIELLWQTHRSPETLYQKQNFVPPTRTIPIRSPTSASSASTSAMAR